MKKVKYIAFATILAVVSMFGLTNVNAAGAYQSTLYLNPESMVTGATRQYASGTHKISISVDFLISTVPPNTITSSGKTKMQVGLWDAATDRYLKLDEAAYTTKTCVERNMGSYNKGNRYYTFTTALGPNKYAGLISNEVLMYPKP